MYIMQLNLNMQTISFYDCSIESYVRYTFRFITIAAHDPIFFLTNLILPYQLFVFGVGENEKNEHKNK